MTKNTDTRQLILDTAATMFHNQSYNTVGVAAICKQANVSKGSFFHFFKSKQDLALEVLEHFQILISKQLINKAFLSSISPMQRFDIFINELFNFQQLQTQTHGHMPGCPFGNMAMEQSTQDEVLREKSAACLDQLASHFQTALSDAINTGALSSLDIEASADAMLSYIEGVQLLAKARNSPELILKLGPAMKLIRIENTE